MRRIAWILLLSAVCGTALARDFSSVEERMSDAEFKAAGLDKLSPEELAALNAWLKQEVEEDMTTYAAEHGPRVEPGFENRAFESRRAFTARIAGHFSGWDGATRFELDNGQVWVQDEAKVLAGVSLDNPRVTLSPGLLGVWRLKVEGYNSAVKVKRIK